MANENALKIAFQKRSPANRVLAFKKCFHGRTLAVSQITDKEAYRLGLPKNLAVDHIPFYDHQNPELSTQESLNALQKLLDQHPGEYAAMLMEVIQGEAGSYPGTKEYFHQLCSLLKKNNISIIVDEVQSFGRTEKIFAFQLFELDQYVDIVTIGKMSLTCATLFRNDHKPKPGLISQTFTSSSTAIKASQYVLDHLVDNHYFGSDGKIAKLSSYFREQLIALNKKYPQHIKGPYGIGAMVAMTIADGDPDKSKAFIKKLFDNGVMSFTAGGGPTRIRFLMPVGAVEESDIKNACEIIEKTLVELLG
jgi:acetylornithine aminotransferase